MMKWSMSAIASILALSLALTVSVAAASDKEAVEAAYKTFNTAFNKGKAKSVAALYTDDAIILPADGGKVVKKSGIEDFFAGFFKNGVTDHKLEIIDVKASGDFLVGASNWSAKGKDGSSFGGLATHVFQKQSDGTLKLTLHIYNYPQK
jgi:ketosteroid isomerase-like protein